jgi:O-antigen ligase
MNKNQISKIRLYLLPISIIVALVPIIVLIKVVELSPIEIAYWKGGVTNADFFSYYKMVLLNVSASIGVLLTYIHHKKENLEIKKTSIYIPMGVYALFIILSTIFAEYKTVALWGFVDRYEGMFSLLSYLIIMFISINLVKDKKTIKYILYPLLLSAIIIGSIGLFQYIGHDFFNTSMGKNLILTSPYKNLADQLKFSFGKNTIYSTLYNTNYVGSYMTIIFSMTLPMLLLIKDRKKKFILAPITLLIFVNLIGSNSRGGILGTAVGVLVLIIMIRKEILKHYKIIIISLIILLLGGRYIDKISEGGLTNQITRLKDDIISLVSKKEEIVNPDKYEIKEIFAEDNILNIVTTAESLKVEVEDDSYIFYDGDNRLDIEFNPEDGVIKILDQRYPHYYLRLISDDIVNYLELSISGFKAQFVVEDGIFKYYQGNGFTKEIKETKSYGFEGKENLGSDRGYIWSRSLPMLKQSLILGNGPDTYAIYFPQEDLKGRLNGGALWGGTLVDKPHNLYLQIGINTGFISLLGFLAIVIMYLIQSVRVYFKGKLEDDIEVVGLGVFISIFSYMVAGIFNDSVVSVAPVFWILLGMGIAINYKLREENHTK